MCLGDDPVAHSRVQPAMDLSLEHRRGDIVPELSTISVR